jgi:predicted RNA binding protein YcfA (HicA-like mRNA interferase family)
MKPIPTRKWKKFLKKLGLEYKRTKGSHEIWDYPDDSLLRPVTFRSTEKDIPVIHIKTNLFTPGISDEDFEKAVVDL